MRGRWLCREKRPPGCLQSGRTGSCRCGARTVLSSASSSALKRWRSALASPAWRITALRSVQNCGGIAPPFIMLVSAASASFHSVAASWARPSFAAIMARRSCTSARVGLQLQRVAIIDCGRGGVAGLAEIFGQGEIGVGPAGRGFDAGRIEILRTGLLRDGQVFAVAVSIVEPLIAGQVAYRDR